MEKKKEHYVENLLITTMMVPERRAPFGGRLVAVAAAVPRLPLLPTPPPLPLIPPPPPPLPSPMPEDADEGDDIYEFGNGESVYNEDDGAEIRIVEVFYFVEEI